MTTCKPYIPTAPNPNTKRDLPNVKQQLAGLFVGAHDVGEHITNVRDDDDDNDDDDDDDDDVRKLRLNLHLPLQYNYSTKCTG